MTPEPAGPPSPEPAGPPSPATRRAVLVSQPTTGGVAVCVRDLAAAAVRAGIQVSVICPEGGRLAGWAAEAGANWARLGIGRQVSLADAHNVVALRRAIAGADLVHLHSSKAGALGRLALRSIPVGRRPATVFTPHAWSWLAGGRMASVYKGFEWVMDGTADVIVAVSSAERALGEQVIRRRRPWSSTRRHPDIRVIPNGVDLRRFTPRGTVAPRPSQPLLVCVGRIARQKGQDIAIAALARMTTRDVRLRLVGSSEPDELAALVALASRSNVADRVEFFGPTDDTAAHFRAADVVLLPSRWEGMSLSMIEAMACGAAVIASDVGGTELLSGGAGVLVPTGDPGALAHAVDRLLADPSRRSQLAATARRKAESDADLTVALAANLGLWEELVRGRRTR